MSGRCSRRSTAQWNDNTDQTSGTLAYTYQWRRADDAIGTNGADIPGATAGTYTLVNADDARFISVKVTATDDGEGLPATASTPVASAYVEVTAGQTPNAPPSKPEGIAASDMGSATAKVTWDPSVDPNGDAVTYKVRVRKSGGSWATVVEGTPATSVVLTDLLATTTYDVRLIASDGTLWSARNMTELFTTLS